MIQNMLARNNLLLTYAGILGFSGVALGAFGAHALKARLSTSGHLQTWETAVLYHLIHATAVLAIAVYASNEPTRGAWLRRAGTFWLVGVLLFSGSLYGLSLGGPKILGPITPLGGLALLVGWIFVFIAGWQGSTRDR